MAGENRIKAISSSKFKLKLKMSLSTRFRLKSSYFELFRTAMIKSGQIEYSVFCFLTGPQQTNLCLVTDFMTKKDNCTPRADYG